MKRAWMGIVVAVLSSHGLIADEKSTELDRFQGRWQVVELVEDGKVIPPEGIRDWLPSGGRVEIVENAILFTSPEDGKKHVKVFSIDPTQYPRGFEISTQRKKDGWGIYRFDEGRLVLCLSHPEEGERPTEFSAKEGSKRMLMVLEKRPGAAKATADTNEPLPRPKGEGTGATAKILTDAETTTMLKGTWRYTDSAGALFLVLNSDGTFSTVREVQELRLFHKTFVQTPISSGKWMVKNGQLIIEATASIHPERVNHKLPFTIRSVSEKDLIFVDYLGRLGQATKVR